MNFNLCTVRPKGFLHASAFAEVKDSLGWALAPNTVTSTLFHHG